MVHYEKDYQYGIAQEKKILPFLIDFFKTNIQQFPSKAKFDFFDDNTNYEVKSRTNTYKRYPTTLITMNKLNSQKDLILLFNFTDSLYYIKYDEELFKKYETQDFSRAGLSWDEKKHIYIDIKDLILIKKY